MLTTDPEEELTPNPLSMLRLDSLRVTIDFLNSVLKYLKDLLTNIALVTEMSQEATSMQLKTISQMVWSSPSPTGDLTGTPCNGLMETPDVVEAVATLLFMLATFPSPLVDLLQYLQLQELENGPVLMVVAKTPDLEHTTMKAHAYQHALLHTPSEMPVLLPQMASVVTAAAAAHGHGHQMTHKNGLPPMLTADAKLLTHAKKNTGLMLTLRTSFNEKHNRQP